MRGKAVHEGIAAYYDNKSISECLQRAYTSVDNDFKQANYFIEPQTLEDLKADITRLLTWYIRPTEEGDKTRTGNSQDKYEGIQVLGVESFFEIEVEPEILLRGIIDLHAAFHMSPQVRGIAIIDHKVVQSGGAGYFYGIEFDPQVMIYSWASRKLGLSADFFGFNVLVTTKQPYLMRHYIPIHWPTVDRYVERAIDFAKRRQGGPTAIPEIMKLPGNPAACRFCPFRPICDLPSQAEYTALTDYEKTDTFNVTTARKTP